MGFKGGNKMKKGNHASAPQWRSTARCGVWVLTVAAAASLYIAFTEFGAAPCNSSHVVMSGGNSLGDHDDDQYKNWSGDLRTLDVAWNRLCFGPAAEKLNLAVFSKKWPVGGVPGGMERHAYTLHKALAQRGHRIHVYTVPSDGSMHKDDVVQGELRVHFVQNEMGKLSCSKAWEMVVEENASSTPFDVIHSESVALPHWRAKGVQNLAATWHGISYEALHSDIYQDLIRKPGETRSRDMNKSMTERLPKLIDEIRFFPSYRHHITISDYAGEVLRNVYQIPSQNVHIILNGVDDEKFVPDRAMGGEFRAKFGVPGNATLVMGVAGRLVKDKGHALLFEAFSEMRKQYKHVYLLVAGTGPWEERYRELAPNAVVLGAMDPAKLAGFYNALDVFVNPTLRPQGLDLTLLEAMQCGKPVLASRFPSITRSVIVSGEYGYTFSPNVASLIENLHSVVADGVEELQRKGRACREYASVIFTATKMASAYERLFLCIKNQSYCHYPLPTDRCPPHSLQNHF
eukprot:Gb_38189 [translate_table: standard]